MIHGLYSIMIPLSSWCVSNCSGCSIFKQDKILHDASIVLKNISRCLKIWFSGESFFISNYDFFLLDEWIIKRIIELTQEYNSKLVFRSSLDKVNENIRFLKDFKRVHLLYQKNLAKESMLTMFRHLQEFMWYNIEYMFWVKDDKNNKLLDFMILKLTSLGFQKISPIDYRLGTVKVRILKHLWWWRLNRLGCIIHKWYELGGKNIFIDNSVFFPSYFEVTTLEWDVRLHEPPCWFWNVLISNIYKNPWEIYNDFKKFQLYINKFILSQAGKSQKQICKECNKKSYHFNYD